VEEGCAAPVSDGCPERVETGGEELGAAVEVTVAVEAAVGAATVGEAAVSDA